MTISSVYPISKRIVSGITRGQFLGPQSLSYTPGRPHTMTRVCEHGGNPCSLILLSLIHPKAALLSVWKFLGGGGGKYSSLFLAAICTLAHLLPTQYSRRNRSGYSARNPSSTSLSNMSSTSRTPYSIEICIPFSLRSMVLKACIMGATPAPTQRSVRDCNLLRDCSNPCLVLSSPCIAGYVKTRLYLQLVNCEYSLKQHQVDGKCD
mmetsp:Transcript_35766/g.36472  ORF Transcript_35766/g.36472 Transcript_35766/m.36472 type:complete len:207 (-) Transcript_35766:618-1238(-)